MNTLMVAASGVLLSTACFWTTQSADPSVGDAPNLLPIGLVSVPQNWITELPAEEGDDELEISEMQDPDGYDPANPPPKMDFHIISGPRKSHNFTGIHESDHPGTTLYSMYREMPWEPGKHVWQHYSYGPKKSLFKQLF